MTEKRVKANIQNVNSINSLKTYLDDNHGFRFHFLYYYITNFVKIFNESPVPKKTIIGKNDWLFLGDGSNMTYSESIGIIPVKEESVNYIMDQITQIKSYCDSIGCKFYFIIAPNKNSIYPEYLPIKPNNNPRFRELLTSELAKTDVNFLDLYDFILKNKNNEILYYKTDTHWNMYTGLIASQYINNFIRKYISIDSISINDYVINKIKINRGDLSEMLMGKYSDIDFSIKNKQNIILQSTILEENRLPYGNITHIKNKSNANNIKAFIFRDSFFTAMYTPFLSAINNSITFQQNIFDKNQVDQIIDKCGKPNFILYEIVERNLSNIEYRN